MQTAPVGRLPSTALLAQAACILNVCSKLSEDRQKGQKTKVAKISLKLLFTNDVVWITCVLLAKASHMTKTSGKGCVYMVPQRWGECLLRIHVRSTMTPIPERGERAFPKERVLYQNKGQTQTGSRTVLENPLPPPAQESSACRDNMVCLSTTLPPFQGGKGMKTSFS